MDPYWRLLCAGIRPDCAADTVTYFNTHRTPEELEAYVREIENRREVSDGCEYCIVVAQAIPPATTITAPVVVTIGDGTEQYPLVNQCCAQVTACALRTRTRYKVRVATSATGGSFKMLGRGCCAPTNNLPAIDGTAPA